MSHIDYYVAQSLDGYISTEDDDLSWLTSTEFGPDGWQRGYGEFLSGIGAIAMGSTTYEWIARATPAWACVPSWLGGGRPAFSGPPAAKLTFLRADVYPTGPVLLRYAVRSAPVP